MTVPIVTRESTVELATEIAGIFKDALDYTQGMVDGKDLPEAQYQRIVRQLDRLIEICEVEANLTGDMRKVIRIVSGDYDDPQDALEEMTMLSTVTTETLRRTREIYESQVTPPPTIH